MNMLRMIRKLNNRVNSMAITLPKYIVSELKLNPAQPVDVYFEGKKIIIDTEIKNSED